MVAILRQTAGQVTPPLLTLHPLPAFDDNYIWTLADASGQAVVVDPGDAAPVLAAAREGLRPVAFLVTHHHPDHIGGLEALQAEFDVPCYGPADPRIPQIRRSVVDGDRIAVPELGVAFEVIAVPGHTRSHVAYHGHSVLFCGDTLFSLGCGRLFEGSPSQMLASLDRLAALPDDTQVCCTHEYTLDNGRFAAVAEPDNPARDARLAEVVAQRAAGRPSLPSSLASERACNPFLRLDAPSLRTTLEQHAEGPLPTRLERFACLRAWKDGYRA